jgi:hypothetical protein
MIPVEEVLSQLDISDVIEYYTGEAPVKGKARCVNPEHEDNNPSMSILPNNTCYCHSRCGKMGILDIVGFYTSAKTLPEKLETLVSDFGLTVADKDLGLDGFFLDYKELKKLDPDGYLLKKYIDLDTFKDTPTEKFEIPKKKTDVDGNYNPIYMYHYDKDGRDITDYIWEDGHIGKIEDGMDVSDIIESAERIELNEDSYKTGGILGRHEVDNIIDIWNSEPENETDAKLFVCGVLQSYVEKRLADIDFELKQMNDMLETYKDEDVEITANTKKKAEFFRKQNLDKRKEILAIKSKIDDKEWRLKNPNKRRVIRRDKGR